MLKEKVNIINDYLTKEIISSYHIDVGSKSVLTSTTRFVDIPIPAASSNGFRNFCDITGE
jgi:hypothetical protein